MTDIKYNQKLMLKEVIAAVTYECNTLFLFPS